MSSDLRALRSILIAIAIVAAVGLVAISRLPQPHRHWARLDAGTPTVERDATTLDPTRSSTSEVSRGGERSAGTRWKTPTPPASIQPTRRDNRQAPVAGRSLTARASWYAAGLPHPDAFTFASRTLGRGTRVRFTHGDRSVVAVCNDYGPASWTGRQFDLSRGAFAQLAPLRTGVIEVGWEIVG